MASRGTDQRQRCIGVSQLLKDNGAVAIRRNAPKKKLNVLPDVNLRKARFLCPCAALSSAAAPSGTAVFYWLNFCCKKTGCHRMR